MLEEGKITVEEAEKLLSALGDTEDSTQKKQSAEQSSEHNDTGQSYNGRDADDDEKKKIEHMRDELYEGTERFISTTLKGVGMLFDKLGKGFQKVQEEDFDFGFEHMFSKGIKITEELYYDNFDYNDITVISHNGSIQCYGSDDDQAKIVVHANVYKAKTDDEAIQMLKKYLVETIEGQSFALELQQTHYISASMHVYLPRRVYESIVLQTQNGSLRFNEGEGKQVRLHTTNGSVRINEATIQEMDTITTNGRIQMNDVSIRQGSCSTTNGGIQVDGSIDAFTCETTNGGIRIEQQNEAASEIIAKTHNGSVRIMYPENVKGVYGDLNASLGKIQCSFADEYEKSTKGRKASLDFHQDEEEKHYIKATTTTGGVYIYKKGDDWS